MHGLFKSYLIHDDDGDEKGQEEKQVECAVLAAQGRVPAQQRPAHGAHPHRHSNRNSLPRGLDQAHDKPAHDELHVKGEQCDKPLKVAVENEIRFEGQQLPLGRHGNVAPYAFLDDKQIEQLAREKQQCDAQAQVANQAMTQRHVGIDKDEKPNGPP